MDVYIRLPLHLSFSASVLAQTGWDALGSVEILSLSFIVVGDTFGCFMLVVVGQKNLRPVVAGMYNYVQPFVSFLVAVYLGLDSFNVMKGVAAVLIFGGVFLVTTSQSRKYMEEESSVRRARHRG